MTRLGGGFSSSPSTAQSGDQDAGAVSGRALTYSRERLAAGVLPTWLSFASGGGAGRLGSDRCGPECCESRPGFWRLGSLSGGSAAWS